MKLTAKVIPWSSIVGTGLMLMDDHGRCIGQLSLHNVTGPGDRNMLMVEIAHAAAAAINGAPRGR